MFQASFQALGIRAENEADKISILMELKLH